MGVVMFKKFASGFMLSFLCFVQVSCCTINTYKSTDSHDIYVNYLDRKFSKNKSKVINQNFIFLQKYVMTKNNNDYTQICYKGKQKYTECNEPLVPINSASGYVVKIDRRKNDIYALTAAHWCKEETKDELYESTDLIMEDMPIVGYYVSFMGNNIKIKKYIMDPVTDLCLIKFNSKYSNYAKNIDIANSDPDIGDKMYTISAPMWSYENELRQHYSGYASGCDSYECAFTIPATYGSSGSAVINEKGEIVSIISKASIGFNNYTIGAKPEQVKDFLEKAYETLRK